jgi:hypothetical protein
MTEPRKPTDVVTRELLDERTCRLMAVIGAAKELEVERHAAIDAKLQAASTVLNERLYHLNELRGDVVTKKEYTAHHESLAKEFHAAVDLFAAQIASRKEWKAEQGGKASQTAVVGAYVIAVLGWIIGPLVGLALERLTQ